MTNVRKQMYVEVSVSLVPRPTPYFHVLRFALTNVEERRGEKRGRPGIIHHMLYVKWT